jgi:hypothetical protein
MKPKSGAIKGRNESGGATPALDVELDATAVREILEALDMTEDYVQKAGWHKAEAAKLMVQVERAINTGNWPQAEDAEPHEIEKARVTLLEMRQRNEEAKRHIAHTVEYRKLALDLLESCQTYLQLQTVEPANIAEIIRRISTFKSRLCSWLA